MRYWRHALMSTLIAYALMLLLAWVNSALLAPDRMWNVLEPQPPLEPPPGWALPAVAVLAGGCSLLVLAFAWVSRSRLTAAVNLVLGLFLLFAPWILRPITQPLADVVVALPASFLFDGALALLVGLPWGFPLRVGLIVPATMAVSGGVLLIAILRGIVEEAPMGLPDAEGDGRPEVVGPEPRPA